MKKNRRRYEVSASDMFALAIVAMALPSACEWARSFTNLWARLCALALYITTFFVVVYVGRFIEFLVAMSRCGDNHGRHQ